MNTTIRWASTLSRRRRIIGACAEAGLGHPEGSFDLVEVVVGGRDLLAGHGRDRDVGDGALEPARVCCIDRWPQAGEVGRMKRSRRSRPPMQAPSAFTGFLLL